jgi:hypothetical protein
MACPTGVTTLGQVLDQITEVFAIGKFSRSGHGKHVAILFLGYQAQGLIGGKARVRHDHHVPHPRWKDERLQHLPKQQVLMPPTLEIDRRKATGTHTGPQLAINSTIVKPNGN